MRCVLVAGFAGVMVVGVAGCGMGTHATGPVGKSALPAISGTLHGGQQPVSGARIQLYAANTTTAKGASTALISSTVLTDAGGNFSITGDYTCPSAGALVYLVATGGNPGLPGSVNNSGLAMMTALGTCGSLTSSTFVQVNELTTVVTVEALAPFMADCAHVGSDSANTLGLSGAFATVASLLDVAGGALKAQATGVTVPAATLYTLADVLAACVNTTGGSAGDGSACGTLFANATGTGTTADTVQAMLHMVQSPAQNVTALFGLVAANAPFGPGLPSAPGSWVLPVGYGGLPMGAGATTVGGRLLAVDTAQHVWVYTRLDTYDAATGVTTHLGSISIFDNNGALLYTIPNGTGGLGSVGELAADPYGNMWAINANLTLSKFGPDGSPLTPAAGLPVPYIPPPFSGGTTANYPLGISYMESDPLGNLWGIGSGSTSNCFIEVNNAGSVITPSGNYCSSNGNAVTIALATDGAGDAWTVGTNSVSKVSANGNLLATGVNSHGCFDLHLQPASDTDYPTLNLAYDRSHDQLWGASAYSVGALRADGTEIFCAANASAYGLFPPTITFSTVGGVTTETTAYNVVSSMATDGAGNLWMTTYEMALTLSGTTAPIYTATNTTRLLELAPDGTVKASYGPGVQVGFFVGNAMAVDGYGNLWVLDSSDGALVKLPGMAVPKSYQ